MDGHSHWPLYLSLSENLLLCDLGHSATSRMVGNVTVAAWEVFWLPPLSWQDGGTQGNEALPEAGFQDAYHPVEQTHI